MTSPQIRITPLKHKAPRARIELRSETWTLKMRSRYAASCRTSSPLTRGKQPAASGRMGASGLIPAHAGKTLRRSARPRSGWDHPRSCGENHLMTSVAASLMGSSPLMPGRRGRRFDLFPDRGLIPAHAEKTSRMRRGVCGARAHPRSRGENVHGVRTIEFDRGSSPLTRGKHERGPYQVRSPGLIPTHARKNRQLG